jgi:DNA-binding FadR family transcriptional regulator
MQSADGQAAEPSQRWQQLGDLILAESRAAGLGPGGQLPTERELASTLGVTRSSVRHALAALAARGMLSREVGRGTFLLMRPYQPGGQAASGPDGADVTGAPVSVPGNSQRPASAAGDYAPADVMTVRRLFEPPAMSLVVAWATAADLSEMDRCLAGGDKAADYAEFEAWDMALHRAIMAASHSSLLVTLYAAIEAARHGQVWGDLKRRSASAERRQQYQADHHAIVAALRTRDSAGAVEAMRVHLARVAEHLNATDPAAAVSWR